MGKLRETGKPYIVRASPLLFGILPLLLVVLEALGCCSLPPVQHMHPVLCFDCAARCSCPIVQCVCHRSVLELGLACSPLPARHPIRSLTLSCWTKVAHTSSPPCEFCGTHALMIVIFGHCRPARHSNISPTISHEASHQPGKTSSSAPPPARCCHWLQCIIICLKKSPCIL